MGVKTLKESNNYSGMAGAGQKDDTEEGAYNVSSLIGEEKSSLSKKGVNPPKEKKKFLLKK